VTNETTILLVILLAACTGTHVPCDRGTPMSVRWHQLLRKSWRDVTRQIDITLRHHERQDYDALYKEVSCVFKELTVHSAEISVHDCQPINPLSRCYSFS
jgi:hypothetical protein